MKCPRTGNELRVVKVGGITVEISESCGGVFFDNLELDEFKNSDGDRGKALANYLNQFNQKLPNEHERIKCPKCEDVVMMRRYYSPLQILEIDECPSCAGIWLDAGELEKLQDIRLTENERNNFRNQMEKQAVGLRIESPKHSLMSLNETSRIEKVFEIAMNLFR